VGRHVLKGGNNCKCLFYHGGAIRTGRSEPVSITYDRAKQSLGKQHDQCQCGTLWFGRGLLKLPFAFARYTYRILQPTKPTISQSLSLRDSHGSLSGPHFDNRIEGLCLARSEPWFWRHHDIFGGQARHLVSAIQSARWWYQSQIRI